MGRRAEIFFLLAGLSFTSLNCLFDGSYAVKVSSNTSWQLLIDDAVYNGVGNNSFEVSKSANPKVMLKKKTASGFINLTIDKNGQILYDKSCQNSYCSLFY